MGGSGLDVVGMRELGRAAPQSESLRYTAPVISELEIWRAATAMVKRYGDTAGSEAAQRADELLAEGDVAGRIFWFRVGRAIKELQRTAPDGTVH